jgi:hypothetical protein
MEFDPVKLLDRKHPSLARLGIAASVAVALTALLAVQLIASAGGSRPEQPPKATSVARLPPHLRPAQAVWPGFAARLHGHDSGGDHRIGRLDADGARLSVRYDWEGPNLLIDDGRTRRVLELRFLNAEIDGSMLRGGATEIVADDRWIEYRRGPLVEWYADLPAALQQGFTVEQAVPGDRLVVRWALDAWLDARSDREIRIETGLDGKRLLLADLHARDADGASLPAHIRAGDGRFSIAVDLNAARFPVVIGPLRIALDGTE